MLPIVLVCCAGLGQCDAGDIRLELGCGEVPVGEPIEISLYAAGVPQLPNALWVCGLGYDPAAVELLDARPSDAVGPNPADVFRAFPDLGRATLDYTAIPLQSQPVVADPDGRFPLALLTVRLTQPADRVVVTLTPTFRSVSGLPGEGESRIWYCTDWQPLDAHHLSAATLAAGDQYRPFVRGDADGSDDLTAADALAILRTLFTAQRDVACLDAADVDDDGRVNVTDAIVLIRHLFSSGRPPSGPFPAAGFDPTPDGRGCPY